jgi:hypothetical protein
MKITMIVAEEFRQEASNKITALGIYATQSIMLNSPPGQESLSLQQKISTLPIALDRLGFIFSTTEIVGEHEVYLQIITPTGSVIMESKKEKVNISQELSNYGHSYVIQSSPFIIPEVGDYICRYLVDETPNDFMLKINFL